jgi:hypothetical protein
VRIFKGCPRLTEELSIREFAKRDGCDDKLVRRKIKSGHLAQLPNGKISSDLIGTAWRKSNADTADKARTAPVAKLSAPRSGEAPEQIAERIISGGGFTLLTKAEAEQKKENYLALLRELEYDRDSGSVVAVADVARKVASEYALVRNRLLSIPARVAPRVAVIKSAEEVKALLEAEISQALRELACDADQIVSGALPARRQ